MAEVNLTQADADMLIAMDKHHIESAQYDFPDPGAAIHVPLVSSDKREHFLLDVRRGRIDLAKATYQNRARQVIVLVRLDVSGRPHRNPDDQEISCPHIHLYREGSALKWASPLPAGKFKDTGDLWRTLWDFIGFCNVSKPPQINRRLF
jgi:hypothetical protein